MPVGMPREDDYKAVHDYYRVLNVILTAGVVMEIMLVPPVIDRKQGIMRSQDLRSKINRVRNLCDKSCEFLFTNWLRPTHASQKKRNMCPKFTQHVTDGPELIHLPREFPCM